MTPEAQRIAIAEFCGWSKCRIWITDSVGLPVYVGTNPEGREDCVVPDYTGDLNAIHSAEMFMAHNHPDLEWRYDREIRNVVQGTIYEDGVAIGVNALPANQFYIALIRRAKAADRAEAFVKTIGKWVKE